MLPSVHIGYGTFHLEWFQPGEPFARFDGSPAEVCRHQPQLRLNPTPPQLLLPDHIQVWIHVGTSNATKVYFHRHALVHAVTPEQARLVQARIDRSRIDRSRPESHHP